MAVVRKILLVILKKTLMSNILLAMASLTPLRTLADTGSYLRTLRLERNRTQEEVTAAVGLSRRALSALESGSAPDVRLQTLLKLLRYYNSQLMVAPESPVPTLAQLDFERSNTKQGSRLVEPDRPLTRVRATGQRRRAKE
jgi:transcriptional regulator with XRE-family HTH domain